MQSSQEIIFHSCVSTQLPFASSNKVSVHAFVIFMTVFFPFSGHLNPKVELAVMAFSELRADVLAEMWHFIITNLNSGNVWSAVLGPLLLGISRQGNIVDAAASSSSSSSGREFMEHFVSGEVWDPMSGWAEHELGLLLFAQQQGDVSAGFRCNNYDNSTSTSVGSCSNNSDESLAAVASLRNHERDVCAGQGWLAMVMMLSHVAFGVFTVCMTIGAWLNLSRDMKTYFIFSMYPKENSHTNGD